MCMLFPEVSKHAAFKYLLEPVPKSFSLLLKTFVISETFIGTRWMIPEEKLVNIWFNVYLSSFQNKKVKGKKVLLVAKNLKCSFHVSDISFSTKNDYLLQKRSNYKVRYDFQNIVYSPKNGCRTKNIIIDYNNENRVE